MGNSQNDVFLVKDIQCPFCSREVETRLQDYQRTYGCACGAEYWPEALEDATGDYDEFARRHGKEAEECEFEIIRKFDFLVDDEGDSIEQAVEWVLVFAKC